MKKEFSGNLAVISDASWYKDAIIYELHIRAFRDSNGDGIGDFRGLTEKLDYLQGLGITAIWLLPFYPSPLRDDGYDIADYLNIHSDYGTMKDLKQFLKEAHLRNIRVIAELVLNHTSSEHLWFQRSRRAPKNSRLHNMYVWSEQPDKYKDARIIFKDFESSNWSWDPVAGEYFWHRFYSHQPDLNYDNESVQKAMFRVIDFWFSLGIDGLRLDAVPYLFEKEGTNCENLFETHQFLKKLREHVDKNFKDKMLLAEANQWPEEAVAYFGDGDECQMAFHFPLMPRMFMAVQMEDHFPIIDILKSTPEINESCQWAIFLRNHDELTLEMVTDEERDYMYRVYAKDVRAKINIGIRRRLAPLLSNNRRKIELMNILLFSLPGTPIIYYGDEIGMGDNFYLGDRNGVRTPMQWSPDRNAGFSETHPHRLYLPVIIDPEYHYETLNVQNQDSSYSSLLWWMRNVITMRKKIKAFSRGTFRIVQTDNSKVFSFVRCYGNENVVVVVNLSRYSQVVHLNLALFSGMIPEEIFGKSLFPVIHDAPYVMTMGPYDYYWLLLQKQEIESIKNEKEYPVLKVKNNWESVFSGKMLRELEDQVLPAYLARSRWFNLKSRRINKVAIKEKIKLMETDSNDYLFLILKVDFSEGPEELYLLPVAFTNKQIAISEEEFAMSVIAKIDIDSKEGKLIDGTYSEKVHNLFYRIITERRKVHCKYGDISGFTGKKYKSIAGGISKPVVSRTLKIEQSNSSILYGENYFLKLYRRLEEGINPELEIFRFLDEFTDFVNIPPFAGALEFTELNGKKLTLALMQGYVENSGNAWSYFSTMITRYYETILSKYRKEKDIAVGIKASHEEETFLEEADKSENMIEDFFNEMVALLGKRTAELHCALNTKTDQSDFIAEPFSQLYQRSLYQSLQGTVHRTFRLLEQKKHLVPDNLKKNVEEILKHESKILERMKQITNKKIESTKIRIHGDYHLGQVLYTGKDFVILDFEGEPARPLSERKLKRSPFRDIAGMLRSFHYAAYTPLLINPSYSHNDITQLDKWIEPWYEHVSKIFIRSYLENTKDMGFIPPDKNDSITLLDTFLCEKAVYELGYELTNRPEWLIIPIHGLMYLMEDNRIYVD